jgi:hypothetical protein
VQEEGAQPGLAAQPADWPGREARESAHPGAGEVRRPSRGKSASRPSLGTAKRPSRGDAARRRPDRGKEPGAQPGRRHSRDAGPARATMEGRGGLPGWSKAGLPEWRPGGGDVPAQPG